MGRGRQHGFTVAVASHYHTMKYDNGVTAGHNKIKVREWSHNI